MKIWKIRKQLNLTQTEFGNLWGIPLRTIQHWENGDRKAPDYILKLIIESLKYRGLLKDEDSK